MNNQITLGLLLGALAYVLLYTGKGMQKLAIEGFKEEKKIKSKNTPIWFFGNALAGIFMLTQWAALNYAPINIIAPLEGIGLIALLIFSSLVLKESISKNEGVGIALIITGTIIAASFNTNTSSAKATSFELNKFLYLAAAFIIVEIILIIISKYNNYKFAGLIIGFTAGTMMAFQTLTKRISWIDGYGWIFTALVIIFATATFGVTQFGFVKAKANQIVPCFTSASIIIATLTGALILNEKIIQIQMIGIASIVIGVIFLTAFSDKNKYAVKKGGVQ